jgi:hypothetical protein
VGKGSLLLNGHEAFITLLAVTYVHLVAVLGYLLWRTNTSLADTYLSRLKTDYYAEARNYVE